jgi:chromosomal replication initiator protein
MPHLSLPLNLWETVKCDFKSLFPEDVFQMWFEPVVCLETSEDSITLGVPNDFAAIWIHDNYLDLITQRLRLTAGRAVSVNLQKSEGSSRHSSSHKTSESTQASAKPKVTGSRRTSRSDDRGPAPGTLNPRNTFETFVVGSNNQMAHAAALAVAQAPAQAYNPLFIYGDTGLGKTHLMHAIGHAILRNNPDARVAYLSTEKFTNDFIQALQENGMVKFRQRYRHADVMLLDDVQFLAGKERIQEEFFHTFNDLFESGKQIVLSSDRRASEIQKLEARLVSRFEWGLPADIQAPGPRDPHRDPAHQGRQPEVRPARADHHVHRPEHHEEHPPPRGRDDQGGELQRAQQQAARPGDDGEAAARHAGRAGPEHPDDRDDPEARRGPLPDPAQRHDEQAQAEQHRDPRQAAMYLARTLTKHSLQEIGDAFGGRDHGTVIHACKAVDNMMEQDASMRGSVEFLKTQLSR